ncbi:sensor histidine kinase [Streptacidiphilus griseoplanus]|uniref:sensor histidine kinase n=1 Tax=Peterkaempfera griseoplana TaxID=66896 RepID=UPI000ACCCB09|nr:ATP-binding protein [Peterkaempfera griseoplana]
MLNPLRLRAKMTFRAKLATAFAALFFLAGAAVLIFVAALARHGTVQEVSQLKIQQVGAPATTPAPAPAKSATTPSGRASAPPHRTTAPEAVEIDKSLVQISQSIQDAALQQMLLWSTVGLAVMALLSGVMGWWLAGRALRPLREVTGAARRMSEKNLHERLQLDGPKDELLELADTYDAMLDRLERSFTSQRRFVANASHELLTPLAVQRTSIQVGLADPTTPELAEVREDLLAANHNAEHLVRALLLLARSDGGLGETEPTDLATLTAQVADQLRPLAAEHGVALTAHTSPLTVNGDPVLLKHLIANLLRNAVQYNHPGGSATVRTEADRLTVVNTGPLVPQDRISDLFEPFRRLAPDRTGSDGHGLGLSIASSIAAAHQADIDARPGPQGGLHITVTFPEGRTRK